MEKRLKEEALRYEELERKANEKAKASENELKNLQQKFNNEKLVLDAELKRKANEASELKAQIAMQQEANAQLMQQRKAQVCRGQKKWGGRALLFP